MADKKYIVGGKVYEETDERKVIVGGKVLEETTAAAGGYVPQPRNTDGGMNQMLGGMQ